MKKMTSWLLMLIVTTAVHGQVIEDVQCINKFSETRFVTLLSDKTLWWSVGGTGWQQIPLTGLPAKSSIKSIDVYAKFTGSNKNTRLVAVLDDNTIWWYADGTGWDEVPLAGLPKNAVIKMLKPYVKFTGLGAADTRFIVVLDNNSMWWFALNEEWKPLKTEGLPSHYEITGIGTYQKVGMVGTETRYIITLSDQSVWWYLRRKEMAATGVEGVAGECIV